jgi:hypothetical protein
MRRLLDLTQLCVYLVGIVVMLWIGNELAGTLLRLQREMDHNAIVHDQMLKDHLRGLQDHERLMQR